MQSPTFVATSVSPAQFRDQNIINPRHPGGNIKWDRNVDPFDAHINRNPTKNSDPTTFFSHVLGLKAVPREVADVDAIKRMNFASNPVLSKSPKFVDLRLSTVNTADKLNSTFAPATRDWLATRHSIAEVTRDRVSEAKEYSEYIKKSEFETMKVFERENISGI